MPQDGISDISQNENRPWKSPDNRELFTGHGETRAKERS